MGDGKGAYFLRPTRSPEICKQGVPLTFRQISVYRVAAKGRFDRQSWTGDGGTAYSLSMVGGKIESTQAAGAITEVTQCDLQSIDYKGAANLKGIRRRVTADSRSDRVPL